MAISLRFCTSSLFSQVLLLLLLIGRKRGGCRGCRGSVEPRETCLIHTTRGRLLHFFSALRIQIRNTILVCLIFLKCFFRRSIHVLGRSYQVFEIRHLVITGLLHIQLYVVVALLQYFLAAHSIEVVFWTLRRLLTDFVLV